MIAPGASDPVDRERLIVLTGPIGAGKNTVAALLARRLTAAGRTVAVVDVDDVARTVVGRDSADVWAAAHRVHGAVVARWLDEGADVVAVGPFYDEAEQRALTAFVPADATVTWVLLDADVATTFARVQGDPSRGRSKEHDFHHERHARYRRLAAGIPADLRYDSGAMSAERIASAILESLTQEGGRPVGRGARGA